MKKERIKDLMVKKFQEANERLQDIHDTPLSSPLPVMGKKTREAYERLVYIGIAYYKKHAASKVLSDLEDGQHCESWGKDAEMTHAEIAGAIKALKLAAKYVFGVDAAYYASEISK